MVSSKKYNELAEDYRRKNIHIFDLQRTITSKNREIEDLKSEIELKDLKIRALEADKQDLKTDMKYLRGKALKYDELMYQESFTDEEEIAGQE